MNWTVINPDPECAKSANTCLKYKVSDPLDPVVNKINDICKDIGFNPDRVIEVALFVDEEDRGQYHGCDLFCRFTNEEDVLNNPTIVFIKTNSSNNEDFINQATYIECSMGMRPVYNFIDDCKDTVIYIYTHTLITPFMRAIIEKEIK